MHFCKNSGPQKTQVFNKNQVFFSKTQIFSPKIRGFSTQNTAFAGLKVTVTKKTFQKTQIKMAKTQLFRIFKSRAKAKVRTKKAWVKQIK